MLDFDEELKKYQPALEVAELQNEINANEVQDITKLLQYVLNKNNPAGKE